MEILSHEIISRVFDCTGPVINHDTAWNPSLSVLPAKHPGKQLLDANSCSAQAAAAPISRVQAVSSVIAGGTEWLDFTNADIPKLRAVRFHKSVIMAQIVRTKTMRSYAFIA